VAKVLIAAALIAALAGGTARGGSTLEKRAPRPHHGKTFVVTPTKGQVIVYRRGNRKIAGVPVALARGKPVAIPTGTVVDASAGTAVIESAPNTSGSKIDRGTFSQGAFAVRQVGANAAVSVGGNGPRVCSRPRRLISRVRAGSRFLVLVGAKATTPAPSGIRGATAAWVSMDRCTSEAIRIGDGELHIARLGSRHATPRRASQLFARGAFRVEGHYSTATVRGRVGGPFSP
jgi:hypothetical protein